MDRERITISIKKKVLNKIDELIDGTTIRNRSHAIETLALKSIGLKEPREAVIILGGDNAMKSVPAAKEYLPQLKEAGFDNIIIAVGFLADKIKEKLGYGVEYDLAIKYHNKGEGSGGALNNLKKELSSTFIVVNTAQNYNINIKDLLNFHKEHKSVFTVATNDLDSFAGIYIIEPETLSKLPKGFSMIETDLIPELIKTNKLLVFPINN